MAQPTDLASRQKQALQDQIDAHNTMTNAASKTQEVASLVAARTNSRSPNDAHPNG